VNSWRHLTPGANIARDTRGHGDLSQKITVT
jgi:hypothetical protein